MKVYYTSINPPNDLLTEIIPVKKIFSDLLTKGESEYQSLGGIQSLFHCPATKDFNHNRFSITSTYDLTLKISNNPNLIGDFSYAVEEFKMFSHDEDAAFNDHVAVRDSKHKLLSLVIPHIWFMPEKPVIMRQEAALYSNSDFSKKTHLVSAQFDAYKHPRPLDISFFVKENVETIKFNYESRLYDIKFETDEEVELVPFTLDNELIQLQGRFDKTKNFTKKVFSLEKWYHLNSINNYPKRIINYIEKNSL